MVFGIVAAKIVNRWQFFMAKCCGLEKKGVNLWHLMKRCQQGTLFTRHVNREHYNFEKTNYFLLTYIY